MVYIFSNNPSGKSFEEADTKIDALQRKVGQVKNTYVLKNQGLKNTPEIARELSASVFSGSCNLKNPNKDDHAGLACASMFDTLKRKVVESKLSGESLSEIDKVEGRKIVTAADSLSDTINYLEEANKEIQG